MLGAQRGIPGCLPPRRPVDGLLDAGSGDRLDAVVGGQVGNDDLDINRQQGFGQCFKTTSAASDDNQVIAISCEAFGESFTNS